MKNHFQGRSYYFSKIFAKTNDLVQSNLSLPFKLRCHGFHQVQNLMRCQFHSKSSERKKNYNNFLIVARRHPLQNALGSFFSSISYSSKYFDHNFEVKPNVNQTCLHLLPFIPKDTFETLLMLDEVKTLPLFSKKNEDMSPGQCVSQLSRVHDIFARSSIGIIEDGKDTNQMKNPLITIKILLAHYHNISGEWNESSKVIRSIRALLPSIIVNRNKESDIKVEEDDNCVSSKQCFESEELKILAKFYVTLLSAQAQTEWKMGDFRDAERLAQEMEWWLDLNGPMINEDLKKVTKICSETSIGIARLFRFSYDSIVESPVISFGDEDDYNKSLISQRTIQNVLYPFNNVTSFVSDIANTCEKSCYDNKHEETKWKLLEAHAYNNYGIAQAILFQGLASMLLFDGSKPHYDAFKQFFSESKENEELTLPKNLIDAHDSIKKGYNILNEHSFLFTSGTSKNMMLLVKANMLCNMAELILLQREIAKKLESLPQPLDILDYMTLPKNDELLNIASKYSREALQIYEALVKEQEASTINQHQSMFPPITPLLSRALSIISSCYMQTESAVTAEGLMQSSIDYFENFFSDHSTSRNTSNRIYHPHAALWYCELLSQYALLCSKWSKRQKESDNLVLKKEEYAELELKEGWKSQPGILAGISYISPGDAIMTMLESEED